MSAEQLGASNRNTTASVDYSWELQTLLHLFSSAFRTWLKFATCPPKHAHPYFHLIGSVSTERWEFKEGWCRSTSHPHLTSGSTWGDDTETEGPVSPPRSTNFPFLEFSPSLQSLSHLVLENLLMPLLLFRLTLQDISDRERQEIS